MGEEVGRGVSARYGGARTKGFAGRDMDVPGFLLTREGCGWADEGSLMGWRGGKVLTAAAGYW